VKFPVVRAEKEKGSTHRFGKKGETLSPHAKSRVCLTARTREKKRKKEQIACSSCFIMEEGEESENELENASKQKRRKPGP